MRFDKINERKCINRIKFSSNKYNTNGTKENEKMKFHHDFHEKLVPISR